jgi:hypothetical protein
MMKRNIVLLMSVFSLFSMVQAAHAEPKFLGILWGESHWKNQDFNPHYDNGTDPHNSQWTDPNWSPADWIKSAGGDGTKLVTGWINAGILVGSYKDSDGVPYLEVGPNFYHLSGYDKRRVTQTLDAIYQVTANKPSMYFLKDADTQRIIGTYTKEGLNLE